MVDLTGMHGLAAWLFDYLDAHYMLSTVKVHEVSKEEFRRMEVLGDRR